MPALLFAERSKNGGDFVEEKIRDILEQYQFEVYHTYRGRGAFICETDQGLKLIKEYDYSPSRLEFEILMKYIIRDRGYYFIDQYVSNREGEYLSKNKDGKVFVVKDWFEGKECDTKSLLDIGELTKNLARLHKLMTDIHLEDKRVFACVPESLSETMERHNQELVSIRNYIRGRKQKNEFDELFMDCFGILFAEGEESKKHLESSGYTDLLQQALDERRLCHGDYHQHNVLIYGERMATVNFDKMNFSIQMDDLYLFLRKMMEKNQWNQEVGETIIRSYLSVKEITRQEMEYLYIRLLYPEKWWKISNHYYNSRKSWTSKRNLEKLQVFIQNNENRKNFVASLLLYF